MLFWLGTAMAPSVSSGGNTTPTVTTKGVHVTPSTAPEAEGTLLPWPADYCGGQCPEPFMDPSLDSDDWRPQIAAPTTTVAAQSAPRVLAPAPAPAPRPVEEWRSLVSAYFSPEHVDLALVIISCESGGDPNRLITPTSGRQVSSAHPRYWNQSGKRGNARSIGIRPDRQCRRGRLPGLFRRLGALVGQRRMLGIAQGIWIIPNPIRLVFRGPGDSLIGPCLSGQLSLDDDERPLEADVQCVG